MADGWPFAFWPDAARGRCWACHYDGWMAVVFEHDDAGGLTGAFRLWCISCLRKDGDPLVSRR